MDCTRAQLELREAVAHSTCTSPAMPIISFTNSFSRLYELKKPEKALKSEKSGYAES